MLGQNSLKLSKDSGVVDQYIYSATIVGLTHSTKQWRLQHLPTMLSVYMFDPKAYLGSMKSAIQIDFIIIIRLLPTDVHIAAFICDGH